MVDGVEKSDRPTGRLLHPLVVTVPLGAWASAFLFDVASKVSEGRVYARGAMWLSVIGLAGAVVAAGFGVLDARRIPSGSPAARTVRTHQLLNAVVFVLFAVGLVVRRGSLDQIRNGSPAVVVVLSGVAVVLLAYSGWLGTGIAAGGPAVAASPEPAPASAEPASAPVEVESASAEGSAS